MTDPYLDWERALRPLTPEGRADEGAEWFAPALVALRPAGAPASWAGAVAALIALQGREGADRVLVEAAERETLALLLALEARHGTAAPGAEVRLTVLRPEHAPPAVPDGAPDDLFTEIRRGAPLEIALAGVGAAPPVSAAALPAPARDGPAAAPVMGVIDDAAPVLHPRLRTAGGRSRCLGAWMQAFRDLRPAKPEAPVDGGLILETREIEALFGRDERAAYRDLLRDLHRVQDVRPLERAANHGGAVLDLACGAAPGAADATRVLAVQLPPASVRDTSGRRLLHRALAGVRWISTRALLHGRASGAARTPLVVTLSFGTMAGPKDGSGFLEEALREEARRHARWAALLDLPAAPMRVVLAFGNGFRASMAASAPAPVRTVWRLPPDDRTASWLEIRGDAPLRLELTPPGGAPQTFAPPPGGSADIALPGFDGPPVGRVWRLAGPHDGPEDGPATYLVGMRPTRFRDGLARGAPAGGWVVSAAVAGGGRGRVTLQVQRDDTPAPHRVHGRQSTLDHPRAHGWDPETRAWGAPAARCPITRHGTHSAEISARARPGGSTTEVGDRAIVAAGALVARHAASPALAPARYSAAGSTEADPWTTTPAPALCAAGEASFALPGVRTAGGAGGAAARLGGTSAAAPQVARALLARLAAGREAQDLETEIAELIDPAAPPPDRVARIGAGRLAGRRRRGAAVA